MKGHDPMAYQTNLSGMNRRAFLQGCSVAAVGLSLAGRAGAAAAAGKGAKAAATPEWRNRQAGMAYRQLGRTGMMVSEIGSGGDPVREKTYEQIEYAIDKGLNYLDMAPAYGRGEAEETYGKIVGRSSMRERVFMTTKISSFNGVRNGMYRDIFNGLPEGKQEAILKRAMEMRRERQVEKPGYFIKYWPGQERQWDSHYVSAAMAPEYAHRVEGSERFREAIFQSIEESLKRAKTDYFDVMMCPHGAAAPEDLESEHICGAFEELKRQGKVRFLGVSSHSDPAGILRKATEKGCYDVAMVAYNVANGGYMEHAIREAAASGMGVFAMKAAMAVATQHASLRPIPQWRIDKLDRVLPGEEKAPVRAYLWALQNPDIAGCVSNLWDRQHVDENLSVAGRKVELQPA